jgi:UDP-N-acetylglucosamine 4,6-dehydratase
MKHVIIGGTGTLGTCLTEKLLEAKHDIVVFSRDELKQQEMKKRFPDVRYVLGDIRDKRSLVPVLQGADTVFHVAALKHVDVLEDNPTEAIKTNVLGTINVAEAAIESRVKHVVFSSTDKAVLPINVYGMTKAISERYLLSQNQKQALTKFAVYRWANVLGSRGSVVHFFAKTLKEQGAVNVTDSRMTRFWIHIEDAVEYMLSTYKKASTVEPMIPEMKSASVMRLANAIAKSMGKERFTINFVGTRPGEKLHECILSSHDYCLRSDTADQYTDAELVKMVKRVVAC